MRVLIVDDSRAFADAARTALERERVTVVGSATSGREAVDALPGARPDVVLLDVGLGEESGFDVARLLCESGRLGVAEVILTSTHDADDYADLIEESPAIGFLSKSSISAAAIRSLLGKS